MSKFGCKLIISLNKLFPKVDHPFNMENENIMTYSEWEYKNGEKVLSYYSNKYSQKEIFENKMVLDLGCGAGGKSVYYSTFNPQKLIGIDINEEHINRANEFAKKMSCSNNISFICASALDLPFENNTFDTIIMNDFFEHVSNPSLALNESLRVLKDDGKIFINFPPYTHPWGEHLSDGINIPWVHLFFKEDSMIQAYKALIKDKPDYEKRMNIRFTKDKNNVLHNTYINKMTIKKGKAIINSSSAIIEYHKNVPLKKPLKFITKTTSLFTGMCVYVLRKGNIL